MGGRPRSVQAGPNFWRRRPALKRHWSITLYSHPDVMLVPNPAGKYTISFRTDLTPDADGGFTIHISPELPPDVPESNWLPSTGPGKPWVLVMRLYLPKPDVLDGSWTPPAMTTQT
jgi:hypothetical protein